MIFLGSELVSVVLFPVGLITAFGAPSESALETFGDVMMLASVAGVIIIPIWSMVDAVKVARVNNLAWLDDNRIGASYRISPDLKLLPNMKLAPSLTFSLTF